VGSLISCFASFHNAAYAIAHEACPITAVNLRRVDPARNMRRFYRLDMQPDLFGGVLLVKEWGRIGAQGRMVAERYDTEALAADALQ
jgi:predicted DNA-binding WGR domain protein